jgi:hypothetical protein
MRFVFFLSLFIFLCGCTYGIKSKDPLAFQESIQEALFSKEFSDCSYAPLWVAPLNYSYMNIERLIEKENITQVYEINQRIYPFVLFTKYCLVIRGV